MHDTARRATMCNAHNLGGRTAGGAIAMMLAAAAFDITDDRVADGGAVDAELVGAAGDGFEFEQG